MVYTIIFSVLIIYDFQLDITEDDPRNMCTMLIQFVANLAL